LTRVETAICALGTAGNGRINSRGSARHQASGHNLWRQHDWHPVVNIGQQLIGIVVMIAKVLIHSPEVDSFQPPERRRFHRLSSLTPNSAHTQLMS
jgi:hypothetical protein